MNSSRLLFFFFFSAVIALGTAACCGRTSTNDADPTATAADSAGKPRTGPLLGEDARDDEISATLQAKDLSQCIVEMTLPAAGDKPARHLALNGNGRVSVWAPDNTVPTPTDTAVIPKHKVLRVLVKFYKAGFAALPATSPNPPAGAPESVVALTVDGNTTAVRRTGAIEPDLATLVTLLEQTGDISGVERTNDDCQSILACKTSGVCVAEEGRCVARAADGGASVDGGKTKTK